MTAQSAAAERELYLSHAIREALAEELARDERIILLGEDIEVYGGAFKTMAGLSEEFPGRVRNTPISENSVVGVAVGAAVMGLRPVVEIMFMDFITLAMDQLVNHAGKFHYMYGEPVRVPLVVRCPAGAGRCYGATHSQSLESWFLNAPGIKVAAPATPADAKGLLKTAIRDDNPVVFVESKLLYNRSGPVPEADYTVPFGQARIAREGEDVTVIAYSRMVAEAEVAADQLAEEEISVDLIDLRTLTPLDEETIADSVAGTGRAVVVEEGPLTGGVGAEVSARIMEHCFEDLEAPVVRVAAADAPVPCSHPLEQVAIPSAPRIAAAVRNLMEE